MNRTPNAISVDWLQLHLHKKSIFDPQLEVEGYNFLDIGYGSKVFKKLYKVIEPGGEILGTLAFEPYSSAINPATTIFKLENRVLYQSDYIARTFQFIAACDFTYKGITRIDLAYDCNQYANGLLPDNLIHRYMDNRYLKIGLNNYAVHGNATYKINPKNPVHPSQDDIQPHNYSGILWGSRKSDIQVNIYNKSKELQDKESKPYITDYWKLCGLDLDKPVWRTEIRIQAGGKNLKELRSDRLFTLSIDDLVTQETIEQMFHAYANKYCRFVVRDHHAKAQQMNELKLFSTDNEIIMRPKRATKTKNATRMHKIMINNLDKQIYENAVEDNLIIHNLAYIRDYYLNAYGLEKWHKEQEERIRHQEQANDPNEIRDKEYYRQNYSHFADEVAKRAAHARKMIEEQLRGRNILDNDEDYDESG